MMITTIIIINNNTNNNNKVEYLRDKLFLQHASSLERIVTSYLQYTANS